MHLLLLPLWRVESMWPSLDPQTPYPADRPAPTACPAKHNPTQAPAHRTYCPQVQDILLTTEIPPCLVPGLVHMYSVET